ncbi:Peptidoglycan synthase FtsI [compost metagenome]
MDEPKGLPETYGFRTSGWNAAPLGGAVFERILPMMDLMPSFDVFDVAFPSIVAQRAFGSELFSGVKLRDAPSPDGAVEAPL